MVKFLKKVSFIYMADTPWCSLTGRLWLQSGQFTSTVKASENVNSIDTDPIGVSWDGTNTLWCGNTDDKLYLQSGQFTSTVKTSEYTGGIDIKIGGISWDGTNTPWCGYDEDKLHLQSGQFTSTLKTSELVSGTGNPLGISWDGANTPWCSNVGSKLFLQSGQYTSTIKISEYIGGIDAIPYGISWDGVNTPWVGITADKLYLQSGQFTSTLKTSEFIGSINPSGIGTNDFESRLAYRRSLSNTTSLGQSVSQIGSIFSRSLSNTASLGQSASQAGSIFSRSLSNTITLTQSKVALKSGLVDTLWIGLTDDKLYLQSGQFTSTLKTSEYVGGIDIWPSDISWDGTNTLWSGDGDDKLYLQSGQFTSTLKTSEYVGDIDTVPAGISWDGTNTPWSGFGDSKLYLQSGQFTSTLKTSENISGIDSSATGISWDGTNTPWCGNAGDKLYLQSGQFTSTLKTSELVSGIDIWPVGISWDGTNTLWVGRQDDKLYLQSGQFTSTLKTSEYVGGIEIDPSGISTHNLQGRLGFLKSIIDVLSINDEIDTTIIRIPLPPITISDILTIEDGVLGYIDYIPVDDFLTITDIIDTSLNVIDIIDYFEITDDAYRPVTYTKDTIDILTIIDAISTSYNAYEIKDNLVIQQYVDLNNEIERIVGNNLLIADDISIDLDYAFKIIDNLTIADSVIEKAPRKFIVEDVLTFTDISGGVFQYNIVIEDEFDILYIDAENLIIYRMMDTVERHYTAKRVPWNFLTIQQNAQIVKEITGAISRSITDTLTITDEAIVALSLNNSFTISDETTVIQGKLTKNNLTVIDEVNITRKINKQPADSLILELTVEYTHTKIHTHHEYAPFVGVTTNSDAPTPPSLTEPAITTYTNVRLSYPTTDPTHILTLDGPEFKNRDQLNYTRINRETRGGTLIIFADPIWPKREQFNLQFIGLSENESQEILTFLKESLGKQIKLRDWEGNERTVITLTPDNPITREGFCKNTVNLNFESAL